MITGARRSPARSPAAGNKNAALPILAACLLTEEEVARQRASDPRHRDPGRGARQLGVSADWAGTGWAAGRRHLTAPDEALGEDPASFLLAGPLLARFGEARMPPPGGDFIGRRRLDPHLDASRTWAPASTASEIEIHAPTAA